MGVLVTQKPVLFLVNFYELSVVLCFHSSIWMQNWFLITDWAMFLILLQLNRELFWMEISSVCWSYLSTFLFFGYFRLVVRWLDPLGHYIMACCWLIWWWRSLRWWQLRAAVRALDGPMLFFSFWLFCWTSRGSYFSRTQYGMPLKYHNQKLVMDL